MDKAPIIAPCISPVIEVASILEINALNVWSSDRPLLRSVNLKIKPRQVFGIIGPSGAGKSTLLKCINRLIDLSPNLRVQGSILFNGESIRDQAVDVNKLRSRIGMLFQQPVIFPGSIYRNVILGMRHVKNISKRSWPDSAERALSEAALWNEVKDRLNEPAYRLSIGQQQRLCLARTLAVDPEVILMDEPTSALDPKSTEAIETLILELKKTRTILIVTHNIAQSRRITDWLACVCIRNGAGELVETACCDALLENSTCKEVIDYLGLKQE